MLINLMVFGLGILRGSFNVSQKSESLLWNKKKLEIRIQRYLERQILTQFRYKCDSPVLDKLCGIRVKFFPSFIKHVKIIFTQWVTTLLCSHIEIFQDDSDVHVDHDQE